MKNDPETRSRHYDGGVRALADELFVTVSLQGICIAVASP